MAQPSFPRFPFGFLCEQRVTVPPKRANRHRPPVNSSTWSYFNTGSIKNQYTRSKRENLLVQWMPRGFFIMTILMTNEKRKITYDIIQKSTQIPKFPDFKHILPTITNDNMHPEPTRGECWFFVKKVWNRREYGIFKRWDFLESRILYLFWKKYDRRRVSMKFS